MLKDNNIQENKPKESRWKTVVFAFAILLAFYFISKILSTISTNPAKTSYEKRCAKCHGKRGEGVKEMLPPLANSDWLQNNQDKIACIIKNGIKDKITVNGKSFDIEMLGQENIKDIEITNIINYINTSWNNNITVKTNNEVLDDLKKCK